MIRLGFGTISNHSVIAHYLAAHVTAGIALRRRLGRPIVPDAEDALGILAQLVIDTSAKWGVVAEEIQWEDAEAVLDRKCETPYHFLTRSRGRSKSADLAGMALAVMLTQAPIGGCLYGVAADRDQSRLIIDSMQGYCLRTPHLNTVFSVKAYQAVCVHNHTSYEAISADASSAYGLRPYFVIVDEIAQWKSTAEPQLLWEAVTSAMHKVENSRLVVLTSAGDPAHWSYGIRTHASNNELWRLHEVQGPAPWADPRKLQEQRERLPESSYRRLFLNEWTEGEERLVSMDDVRQCMILSGPQPLDRDLEYVIGLDIGLKHDPTVACIAHNEVVDNRQCVVVDQMEVWQGSLDKPLVLGVVENWIKERLTGAHQSALFRLIVDPWQAVGMGQRLHDEYGLIVLDYPMTTQSITRLAMTMLTFLREHRLIMFEDEALMHELLNIRLKEPVPGQYRIDHDVSQHDDRVMAIALATQYLAQHPAMDFAQAYGYRFCCDAVVPEDGICMTCGSRPPGRTNLDPDIVASQFNEIVQKVKTMRPQMKPVGPIPGS